MTRFSGTEFIKYSDDPLHTIHVRRTMTPYDTHVAGSTAVLELPPRVDSETSLHLEQKLKEVMEHHSTILCDFSQNSYISSLGLRVLLGTSKNMRKTGGTIGLCALSPYVQEIFDISGFSKIFQIYATESDALLELNQTKAQQGEG